MTTQALQIGFIEQAHRIYLFDEVYPLSAAKEQAEKKKLAAFGIGQAHHGLDQLRVRKAFAVAFEFDGEGFDLRDG